MKKMERVTKMLFDGEIHAFESTVPHGLEYFDFSILKKQITKSCHKRGIQACDQYVRIIGYYFIRYMKIFQKEHPRLSSAAMDKIIEALASGSENVPDADFDTYKAMIDKHFMTQYIKYACGTRGDNSPQFRGQPF